MKKFLAICITALLLSMVAFTATAATSPPETQIADSTTLALDTMLTAKTQMIAPRGGEVSRFNIGTGSGDLILSKSALSAIGPTDTAKTSEDLDLASSGFGGVVIEDPGWRQEKSI